MRTLPRFPSLDVRTLRTVAWTALATLAACDGSPNDPAEPVRDLTSAEQQVSAANTGFGLSLLRTVVADADEPNVLLSPLSVSMSLGMATNGARGETHSAMRSTLGFGGMDEAAMNEAYAGLLRQLRARDDKVEIAIANSVWHEQTFPVEQPFLDAARVHFEAEVRAIDFRTPSAPTTISKWAEDRTGGRIRDLIKEIDPNEIMFLVNAVYFKAPWAEPFEEQATRNGSFRTLDNRTVSVPMMTADASRPFFQNDEVSVVEMVYAEGAFGMVLVVPAQGRTLDQVLASLDAQRWSTWMTGLQAGRIQFTMPKFKFDFGTKLNDALTSMGMGIAFDDSRADFDRINPQRKDLYISRVEHKTFIDVHERGTEAAAATATGIGITSLPPSITIDRPFLFAIRERTTGTLLFIGRVGNPAA